MAYSVFIIDDDATLNQLLVAQLNRMGYAATGLHSWEETEKLLQSQEPDLILLDCRLPDANGSILVPTLSANYPVIVITGYGSIKQAVGAMQAGASEYLVKPVNLQELEVVVKRTLENAEMRKSFQFLQREVSKNQKKSLIIGDSPALQEAIKMIDVVAPSAMTVLIQGESGVGKELVAREIHERSTRVDNHFVALDCCTIQENLFESELFGHEKGSFTGAEKQKPGLIETAENGTLFLDEIGEISPAIQAKLLRVLETGKFRRVGGTKDLTSNVRIVAATNRNLAQMSKDQTFRADLYYRLNAFTVHVPPLRDRLSDIPALLAHFIKNHDFSRPINKYPTEEAIQKLQSYNWPGNIRELRNMVERAIILSGSEERIEAEHFTLQVNEGFSAEPASALRTIQNQSTRIGEASGEGEEIHLCFQNPPTLEEMERHYLEVLLDKLDGHRSNIARTMGISERNVYRLIKKHSV